MVHLKRFNGWLNTANKLCVTGHIVLPLGSTQWYSTWKVSQLLKSLPSLRFIAPKYLFGYKNGSKKEWTECSKVIDLAVPLLFPKNRDKNFPIFSTAVQWHTDLLPVSGQALWLLGSSKKNSPSSIIQPMFRAFFMDLGFPSNVRKK